MTPPLPPPLVACTKDAIPVGEAEKRSSRNIKTTLAAILASKLSLIHRLCYAVYITCMWTSPLHIQAELSTLCDDFPVSNMRGTTPAVECTTFGKTSSARRTSKSLQRRWSACTKNLCTQFQMVNYVAAVFIGALVTMLQDPVISSNPTAKLLATTAFLCALGSFCWGVVFQIHISRARTPLDARLWLLNARYVCRCKWWNFEVMFSLPTVWLLWSALLFCLALVLSYICDVSDVTVPPILSRLPGIFVVLVWALQVPLVVWTLARLGKSPRTDAGENNPANV
ncbi:hypothetical protein BC835DRAFT_1325485 [Cytidiella melzeri]|nr:hypothetical protein BC835DRAFT_1325485 [Cytidiella melzeri]